MLELLTYPISAVMKMWHHLLHGIFGLDNSASWIVSIILLVVTVRLFLLPFSWSQRRSAHRSLLMRPEKIALDEKYADSTDPADVEAHQREAKELRERYNYNPMVGCLPMLIQIPIVIGLYRLLMWMARPETMEGHENSRGGIGVLSATDIESFRETQLFGAPLPAYLSMPDFRLAELGTTAEAVASVLAPFIITAAILTTTNMMVGAYFTRMNLDWSQKVNRGLLKFMYAMCVFMPLFILVLGFFGPLPLALALYWVTSNLWTAAQVSILNFVAHRKWPIGEEHRTLWAQQRQELIDAKRHAREQKHADRELVRTAPERGSTRAEAKAEIRRRDQAEQAAAEALKNEEKARKKEISRIRSQQMAKRMKQRRAQRRSGKKRSD